MDAIVGRVTPDEAEQFNAVYAEMRRVACDDERPAPEHGGAFACEGDDDEDSVEDHPALELPEHTMFENQSTQKPRQAEEA